MAVETIPHRPAAKALTVGDAVGKFFADVLVARFHSVLILRLAGIAPLQDGGDDKERDRGITRGAKVATDTQPSCVRCGNAGSPLLKVSLLAPVDRGPADEKLRYPKPVSQPEGFGTPLGIAHSRDVFQKGLAGRVW
jgi:hypothetical protein